MAGEIRIFEDPAHPEGGHAVVEVTGLARAGGTGRFRLFREGYVHGNLGPGGWQVSEALLEATRAEPLGTGIRLYIGPELVRWIESGPVMVALPEADFAAAAFWPDISPLHEEADGARRFAAGDPRARAAPAPPRPQPSPAPAAPAPTPSSLTAQRERLPPTVVDEPDGGQGLLWIGLLAVLAFLVGAGTWWFLRPSTPPPPEATTTATAPPNFLAMSAGDIIRQAKSPQEIDAAARQVQQAGDHDKALILFEEAALRGYAPSSTALAKLYDPNGFQRDKPFKNPDMRQAARYYKAAEEGGDPAAKEPRAALKQTLTAEAGKGNVTAQTALKDFW
jgi:hypothetical protein